MRRATVILTLLLVGGCVPASTEGAHHSGSDHSALDRAVSPAPGGGYVLRVAVWADDDFASDAGPHWKQEAASLVLSSAPLLRAVDVEMSLVEVARWDSGGFDLPEMVGLVAGMPRRADAVVVALTGAGGYDQAHYDGYASAGRGAVVVRVADGDTTDVATLVTHELGHFLGAGHHEDGHECLSGGCLMDAVGFDHPDSWCHHHREQIAAALAATG